MFDLQGANLKNKSTLSGISSRNVVGKIHVRVVLGSSCAGLLIGEEQGRFQNKEGIFESDHH